MRKKEKSYIKNSMRFIFDKHHVITIDYGCGLIKIFNVADSFYLAYYCATYHVIALVAFVQNQIVSFLFLKNE